MTGGGTMQLAVEDSVLENLNTELSQGVHGDDTLHERERASRRIQLILEGLARKLKLTGEVKMFGSFSNGFKTGGSDLDVVFVGQVGQDSVPLLGKFAAAVPECGFENVTKIFQANVPLVKFTDIMSSMEVDFCINNELGVRNSLLLHTYCAYDERALKLGRLVKDWAKRHELVGTADGCLNSYAYMLLVVHFLQSLEEPVVPNLQAMATESVPVTDMKWGCLDRWETKFLTDLSGLPESTNSMSVGELLIRFFRYYAQEFDWHAHAVCMRLNQPGEVVDKFKLSTPTSKEQWYVEDPFDLRHNLAGKCTPAGRGRIMQAMKDSLAALNQGDGWAVACPSGKPEGFFLKCRISPAVTPQALLEEFEEFDLHKLYFPKPDQSVRMGQAFLEFATAVARRRAHTKNEIYVADCQLQLHYSTQHSLGEAIDQGNMSAYEMASYKMQRQVLAARHGTSEMMRSGYPRGMAPGMEGGPGGMMPPGSMLSGAMESAAGGMPPPGFAFQPFGPRDLPPWARRQLMQGRPVMMPLHEWQHHTASMHMQGGPTPPPPPPPPPPQASPPGATPGKSTEMTVSAAAAAVLQQQLRAGGAGAGAGAGGAPPQAPPGNNAKPGAPEAKAGKVAKAGQPPGSAKEKAAAAAASAAASEAQVAKRILARNGIGGGGSTPAQKGCCMELGITSKLPQGCPLLTAEQAEKLRNLQSFLQRYKDETPKPQESGTLIISLKDDLKQRLDPSDINKLRSFQSWAEKYDGFPKIAGAATANGVVGAA